MTTPNLLAVASAEPKILASQQLASGENTIYTVPAGRTAQISTLSLCNTTSGAVTVSVSLVRAGGTAGPANRVVSAYPLAANDATVISEIVGALMNSGDFVSVNAGSAAAISVVMTGLEAL